MELQDTDCGNDSIYRNVIKSFHNIYDNEFLRVTPQGTNKDALWQLLFQLSSLIQILAAQTFLIYK